MNNELLNKIKAHIKAEPRRIWMSVWKKTGIRKGSQIDGQYEMGKEDEDGHYNMEKTIIKSAPPCGTVGCIAGWAIMLKKGMDAQVDDMDFFGRNEGQTALELDRDQAMRLFYVTDWPKRYKEAYRKARSAKARAKVVVDRITYFQRTKGAK